MFVWLTSIACCIISINLNRKVSTMKRLPHVGFPAQYHMKPSFSLYDFSLSKECSNHSVGEVYKKLEKEEEFKVKFLKNSSLVMNSNVLFTFYLKTLLKKEIGADNKSHSSTKIYLSLKDYYTSQKYKDITHEVTNLKADVVGVPESLSAALQLATKYGAGDLQILNFRGSKAVLSRFKVEGEVEESTEKESGEKEDKKKEKKKITLISRTVIEEAISDFQIETIIEEEIRRVMDSMTEDKIYYLPFMTVPENETKKENAPEDTLEKSKEESDISSDYFYCDVLPIKEKIIYNMNHKIPTYEHIGVDIYKNGIKEKVISEIPFNVEELTFRCIKKIQEKFIDEKIKTFYISNFTNILTYNSIDEINLEQLDDISLLHGNFEFHKWNITDPLVSDTSYTTNTVDFNMFAFKLQIIDRSVEISKEFSNDLIQFQYINKDKSESYKKFLEYHNLNKLILKRSFETSSEYFSLYKKVEDENLTIKSKIISRDSLLKMLEKTIAEAKKEGIEVEEYEKFRLEKQEDPMSGMEIRSKNLELKIKINGQKKERQRKIDEANKAAAEKEESEKKAAEEEEAKKKSEKSDNIPEESAGSIFSKIKNLMNSSKEMKKLKELGLDGTGEEDEFDFKNIMKQAEADADQFAKEQGEEKEGAEEEKQRDGGHADIEGEQVVL